MIIKEKFRVFLENLGMRVKISNILFKKLYYLLYVRKIFFQSLLCICPENFFVVCPKRNFNHEKKIR